jgi:HD-GYP domain-containing protein (c-di-GMP phosphodiesterase class II)
MRTVRVYIAALVAVSLLLAVYLLQFTHFSIGWRAYVGLLLFLLINVVSETQPLLLPGSKAQVTISGLSSYAILALFPPFLAGISAATAILLVEAFVKKKPLIKLIFNSSQTFITVVSASLIYNALMELTISVPIPHTIIATFGAILSYYVINTSLVSLLLSLLSPSSFARTWAKHFRWEIIYVVGSVPVVLLLILAYQRLWIAGPLLFVAPLFMFRESYAQYVRLRTTYTDTVRLLIKVIETHDTYTAGHSLRVAEYAKRLAVARKLSVKEVDEIEIAAYLHDLGKVDLAITHLVRKPGRLTPEEKRRVQLHPLVSADLASQITFLKGDIENIIRHHHEHYNGTGYPHGLVGDEIPLGARIILIADAFDAMTSNRRYRDALEFERVRSEFTKCAGRQFDPDLVRTFFELCVRDPSMVIDQVNIEYEELLSTKYRKAKAVSS